MGIFFAVALVAGFFAMDSKQKPQQAKQPIAAQINIENDNKAHAMQKSSEQSPKISGNSTPTTIHRQMVEQSKTRSSVRQT